MCYAFNNIKNIRRIKVMAKSFVVTPSSLRSKASELRNANNSFRAQINQLRSQESSLNSMWDGEANDTFHGAFSRDAQQMENFYNEIQKYAAALEEIARNYERTEAQNRCKAQQRTYH